MESKKRKVGTLADIDVAEKRLKILHENVLPPMPYIMTLPKKNQINAEFRHEHRTLFGFASQAEFEAMQYMTLLTPTNGERGSLLETRGNWEEEIAALNARGDRSNSGTPAPTKTFKNKISLSAYKKNGMKAPPSATGTPDVKSMPGHSRNTSAVSLGAIAMSRGPSTDSLTDSRTGSRDARDAPRDIPRSATSHPLERDRSGSSSKPNGTSAPRDRSSSSAIVNGTNRPVHDSHERSRHNVDRPNQRAEAHTTSTPKVNGERLSEKHNERRHEGVTANEKVSQSREQDRPRDKHTSSVNGIDRSGRDSKSQTSNRDILRDRDGKIKHDSRRSPLHKNDAKHQGHPHRGGENNDLKDQQSKADSNASSKPYTPSTLPRKPDSLPPKPPVSMVKANPKHNSLGSMLSGGKGKSTTPRASSSRPETPKDIPPLLSPLYAPLENSQTPTSLPSSTKKSGRDADDDHRSRGPTSAPKRKAEEGEHVKSEKKRAKRTESPEPRPRYGQMPRLLSPDLPAIIDKALGELKEDKKKMSTVEERHEEVRRPDAKGVARKTVKARGAKAKQKKSSRASEPLSDSEVELEEEPAPKQSLIVKLKYKKTMAKTIERMLKLTPKPEKPSIKVSPAVKDEESSEEDVPLAKKVAAQKRPSNAHVSDDRKKKHDTPIPTSSKTITVTTAKAPQHESPPASSVNSKDLLATPKKGDAMKSVAMRRVDSADGQSRTPQPMAISTPTSAARSTTSEARVSNPEIDKLRAEQRKCGELAFNTKRKMDGILKVKERPRPEIEPRDQKLGLATGIEATIMYIYGNSINTRIHELAGTHTRSHDSCYSVIPLLNWLTTESRAFPVMHALALHLSAMSKEFYSRELTDHLKRNQDDAEAMKKLIQYSALRTNDWLEAEKVKDVLVAPGGATFIGPGMDIKTITDYTLGVLTAFSRTEKTGWKRDGGFGDLRKGVEG